METRIYLAGNISQDPRTYEWREAIADLLKEEEEVSIVDPCRNRFNQGLRGGWEGKDGLAFAKKAVRQSQHLLRPKDYQMIKGCNLMVVNLALSDPDKPMLGTIQELTWAHDIFYIPIIGITEGVENIYTMHSWINSILSAKAVTVNNAVTLIQKFFLEV
jgi:hypothetical protein